MSCHMIKLQAASIGGGAVSQQPYKRQTIEPDQFRNLAQDFGVTLPEKFLFEKEV